MVRYQSRRPPEIELRARLRDLANERRRFGYRRLFILLRREGEASLARQGMQGIPERAGSTGIYRLYREEGLTVRKRRTRRKAIGTRAPILVEARANARPLSGMFTCPAGQRDRLILCMISSPLASGSAS